MIRCKFLLPGVGFNHSKPLPPVILHTCSYHCTSVSSQASSHKGWTPVPFFLLPFLIQAGTDQSFECWIIKKTAWLEGRPGGVFPGDVIVLDDFFHQVQKNLGCVRSMCVCYWSKRFRLTCFRHRILQMESGFVLFHRIKEVHGAGQHGRALSSSLASALCFTGILSVCMLLNKKKEQQEDETLERHEWGGLRVPVVQKMKVKCTLEFLSLGILMIEGQRGTKFQHSCFRFQCQCCPYSAGARSMMPRGDFGLICRFYQREGCREKKKIRMNTQKLSPAALHLCGHSVYLSSRWW